MGTTTVRGVIRRLWPGERARLQAHLLRLDREDRMLRFGGYASDAQIAAYCKRLDWSHALVVGYVVRGKVRGLGQLEPIRGSSPRAAEVAVSVERPFQNRGVGSALLRRVVSAARNRLIERLHMVCLVDNGRAVRLARRLEGTLRFRHGEAEATIEPPWPTCWTWLEELLLEPALSGMDLARPPTPSWPVAGDGRPNAATTRGAPDAAKQLVLPSSR
jgi:ribosomal protein S18 acetylase RimI-like enzyme